MDKRVRHPGISPSFKFIEGRRFLIVTPTKRFTHDDVLTALNVVRQHGRRVFTYIGTDSEGMRFRISTFKGMRPTDNFLRYATRQAFDHFVDWRADPLTRAHMRKIRSSV